MVATPEICQSIIEVGIDTVRPRSIVAMAGDARLLIMTNIYAIGSFFGGFHLYRQEL